MVRHGHRQLARRIMMRMILIDGLQADSRCPLHLARRLGNRLQTTVRKPVRCHHDPRAGDHRACMIDKTYTATVVVDVSDIRRCFRQEMRHRLRSHVAPEDCLARRGSSPGPGEVASARWNCRTSAEKYPEGWRRRCEVRIRCPIRVANTARAIQTPATRLATREGFCFNKQGTLACAGDMRCQTGASGTCPNDDNIPTVSLGIIQGDGRRDAHARIHLSRKRCGQCREISTDSSPDSWAISCISSIANAARTESGPSV